MVVTNPTETIISIGEHIISLRDPMSDTCCSSYCTHWNECYALNYLDFVKVLPLHPKECDKEWCPALSLPSPQGTEAEYLNM